MFAFNSVIHHQCPLWHPSFFVRLPINARSGNRGLLTVNFFRRLAWTRMDARTCACAQPHGTLSPESLQRPQMKYRDKFSQKEEKKSKRPRRESDGHVFLVASTRCATLESDRSQQFPVSKQHARTMDMNDDPLSGSRKEPAKCTRRSENSGVYFFRLAFFILSLCFNFALRAAENTRPLSTPPLLEPYPSMLRGKKRGTFVIVPESVSVKLAS